MDSPRMPHLVVPVPCPPLAMPTPGYTVQMIFREYSFRRVGLIRALTKDEQAFFRKCDQGMQSQYLYGHTDGSWEVRHSELFVQPRQPKTIMLGVNLARGNMKHLEWLRHIAMRCDTWLINVSFTLGANFDAKERERLFTMINCLQTVLEAFLDSDTYRRICHLEQKLSRTIVEEKENIVAEDKASTDQIICASCYNRYHANAFWICCDVCKEWFHGKCVKITGTQAKRIKRFECPECLSEKNGHD